jgi:cytoskeletal protein RodZ
MAERASQDTPGSLIRATRESLDISLAEMSERTKIPPPVLQAIERDEYHKVSGALYIKSFLRTCAVEIGLDPEVVLDLYGSFSGEVKRPAGGVDMVWEEEEVQISHIGLPWRNIAVAGLGLILVGSGVLMLLRGCDSGQDSAAEGPPQQSPQQEASPAAAADEPPELPVPVDDVRVESRSLSITSDDTLAGGWTGGADRGAETPAATSDQDRQAQEQPGPIRQEPAAREPEPASPQAVVKESVPLPLPLVGGPRLVFAGGRRQPVVLRIICDRPLGIQVKRDAEQAFKEAIWPRAGASAPPLPPTGIEPGRIYAISRGLVVYWGADDHLSLRLDRTDGVEVALNGKVRNVRNLRPGGELLLDAHGD